LYGGWLPYIVMDSLILSLIVGAIGRSSRGGSMPLALPVAPALAVFFFYSLVGLINPEGSFLRGLMGLRSLFLCSGLAFAGFASFQDERQIEKVYTVLVIAGAVTGALGVWQ